MSTKQTISELEKVLKKTHRLASDLMAMGEWELGRQVAEVGNKIDQKIQGHEAQRRRKKK